MARTPEKKGTGMGGFGIIFGDEIPASRQPGGREHILYTALRGFGKSLAAKQAATMAAKKKAEDEKKRAAATKLKKGGPVKPKRTK